MTIERSYVVDVIAGDGIGQEVVPAAIRCVDAVAQSHGFGVSWRSREWGSDHYRSHGRMMPADGIEQLADGDAILLGAVGAPDIPDDVTLWGLLIPIRREFLQYVNLRPVRVLPGVVSPLRDAEGVDMLIVRENVEGEYSEVGGRLYRGRPEEMAVQEAVFTRTGVVAEVVGEAGGVRLDKMLVDALAARVVLQPRSLDVIVASNLFGDILSDLAAAVAGSIGVAPSGNLNPPRDHPSMFEPVHGSAPDIAGQGIANPVGQMWAAAMMLEHLGETDASTALISAFEDALRAGVRTRDLGGTAGTEEFTAAVLDRCRAATSPNQTGESAHA
jgi:tartrate dehydrogenase/decarboxylase/D-malate dehydrogenase